jgi:hypothetical protein
MTSKQGCLVKDGSHWQIWLAKQLVVSNLDYTCMTCLGQMPQIEMILFVPHSPKKPWQVGVA